MPNPDHYHVRHGCHDCEHRFPYDNNVDIEIGCPFHADDPDDPGDECTVFAAGIENSSVAA